MSLQFLQLSIHCVINLPAAPAYRPACAETDGFKFVTQYRLSITAHFGPPSLGLLTFIYRFLVARCSRPNLLRTAHVHFKLVLEGSGWLPPERTFKGEKKLQHLPGIENTPCKAARSWMLYSWKNTWLL